MTSIEIEYRRLGITRKKTVNMPSRWDELTAEQLVVIARNYLHEIDEPELLAALLGLKKRIISQMDDYQRFSILRQLWFIAEFKPHYTFVLKNIKGLQAPRPRLEGMSFGQFIFTESYFDTWLQSNDTIHLNKFVACLYLPKESNKFDELLTEDRAEYVGRMFTEVEKTAISINYRLIKEWIAEKYPILFPKPADEMDEDKLREREIRSAEADNELEIEKKKIQAQAQFTDWVKIFERLVDDDIINQDKYAAMPVNTVFRYLTQKIKDNGRKKV